MAAPHDHTPPLEAPVTLQLSPQTCVITCMCTVGKSVFVGSDRGCLYRADIDRGSVDVVAQVHSVWSLAHRGQLLAFSSLNGDVHFLNLGAKYKHCFDVTDSSLTGVGMTCKPSEHTVLGCDACNFSMTPYFYPRQKMP